MIGSSTTTSNGYTAEARVIARCVEMDYRVSIPFGDNAPYDFIVDTKKGKVLRVQVKRIYREREGYTARFSKSKKFKGRPRDRHYTIDDCDYIVCYSCEYDVAYIFPIEDVNERTGFTVYPDQREEKKHQKYREAWF